MEKKEMTKSLLGIGLKELMLSYPFEKITIRMITDKAGVIRPTFYNYFQDKYELLEWIVCEEVLDKAEEILNHHMEKEAFKLLFVLIDRDRAFYRKAMDVTGQNSFESILQDHIYRSLMHRLSGEKLKMTPDAPGLNREVVARYYAMGIVDLLKTWLQYDEGEKAEEVIDSFYYLVSHSLYEIFER